MKAPERELRYERMCQMIEEGYVAKEIALHFGLTYDHTRRLLRSKRTSVKKKRNQEIRALYLSGTSPTVIAARYGLSYGAIKYITSGLRRSRHEQV